MKDTNPYIYNDDKIINSLSDIPVGLLDSKLNGHPVDFR